MKTFQQLIIVVSAAACLGAAASALGDARTDAYGDAARDGVHVHVAVFGDDHIRMDRGQVVITADDGSEARVTPAGDFLVGDKAVAVSTEQRTLLKQYNRQILDIEDRGMQIGMQGAKLALNVLGDVFAGL